MRYVLIFVGAAVVAWLLTKGIRAVMAERRGQKQISQEKRY